MVPHPRMARSRPRSVEGAALHASVPHAPIGSALDPLFVASLQPRRRCRTGRGAISPDPARARRDDPGDRVAAVRAPQAAFVAADRLRRDRRPALLLPALLGLGTAPGEDPEAGRTCHRDDRDRLADGRRPQDRAHRRVEKLERHVAAARHRHAAHDRPRHAARLSLPRPWPRDRLAVRRIARADRPGARGRRADRV